MCGIFGVINTKEIIDESRVISARDVLAHRGPDDAGVYFSQTKSRFDKAQRDTLNYVADEDKNPNPVFVALAHRRLSIIDLSPAAHQPMTSEDGRFTIVYNGEIYNYKDLSKQLIVNRNQPDPNYPLPTNHRHPELVEGHYSLFTNSDTEVILNLYAQYGKNCLNMLRGMFAFAIWDDKEKTLFAARDRFGIKPFYYLQSENEFIFSSELKAINHYKGNLTTNYNALDAFLRTGSVPAPMTIYNEVKALMPGNYLIMHNAQCSIFNYWCFNDLFIKSEKIRIGQLAVDNKQMTNENPENSINQSSNHSSIQSFNHSIIQSRKYDDNARQIIREALLDTVRAHLVADVEVGAFLSGGIDSTAIVSLMRQVGKEKIKTVSIVFPESRFDESKYSRLVAKKYNTEHVEIPFYEKDLLDDLDKIFSVMDQPTIDGINTYFVSKAASQAGLKVVLSGLGGDELFGGYPSFYRIPKYKRIKNLPFARLIMRALAPLLKNKLPAKAIHYMKNPDEPNAEYRLVRGLFTEEELSTIGWKPHSNYASALSLQSSVFSHQIMNDSAMYKESHFDYAQCDKDAEEFSELVKVSYLESCFYMRDQLLRDSDVFSMAHSLELRVPFVDHKLYEAVLPYLDDAYDKNFPKKMLVEAVGDLPEEIVHRPKMGFTFPFEDWIRNGQLKDLIIERLKKLNPELNTCLPTGKTEHLPLNINKLHWSRLWALFIISKSKN
ncbi:MAG: asparagine synthase (glutamine-hydrolyzing) [Ignavibacterium album]|uniref:asparagine synthase (glutamine-hydrolyzing) n=1 Tax=Ignavibacterium album TaxID=591197 RepID=UPI0026EC0105|nr:asparagine synthase (glutamine-hydrolyzing) [Ignavibacterium album]MCX8104712.1 asparagine synthase (glutamine-hydrolyzing) [Ignavibacterium album]